MIKKIEISEELNQFEQEKLCQLLECGLTELKRLNDEAKIAFESSSSFYDALLKILQQGHNIREATFIGILYGQLIGFSEAEKRIENEIKEKLFNAFKNNNRSIE